MFRSMGTKKNKHLAPTDGGTKREPMGVWPQIGPNDHSTPCVNVPMTFAALASAFLVRLE